MINPQLLVGSALFGMGWGVSGVCPGPAIVLLPYNITPLTGIFMPCLVLSLAVTKHLQQKGYYTPNKKD